MAKKLDDDEKLSARDADAAWAVLRMAIAATGLSGKQIATDAGISEATLRQYTAKTRPPSKALMGELIRVLRVRGVEVDLPERSARIAKLPDHLPGVHKGGVQPALEKPKRKPAKKA